MSDIVDKLLYFPAEGEAEQIMDEAKAEIERLREGERAADAEIERLRGLLREAEKMWPNPGLNSESASWYRRLREALGDAR